MTDAGLQVVYEDGGQGRAIGYANLILTLTSPVAFAPGQPLGFQVAFDDAVSVRLGAKSLGSRAREQGGFEVRVRLTNLRRDERLRLEARFAV